MKEGEFLLYKTIKIIGNKFIYNEKEYDYFDFLEVVKDIKRAIIFILNQNIYIRKIAINSYKVNEEEINRIKELEFGEDEEYLIHYEICKKEKCIYMYALNGGKKVSALSEHFSELRVIPLQIQFKNKLEKKVKEKNYQCIFSYLGMYYYLIVNDGYIKRCGMYSKKSELVELLEDSDKHNILYVEKGIDLDTDNMNYIEVGDICSEKILF